MSLEGKSWKQRSQMDCLPVEIVGDILSRLRNPRDVIVASTTCRKWREAYHTCLHTLSFDYRDCPSCWNFATSFLEVIITKMIFQTTGVRDLSIIMSSGHKFSVSTVLAWFMHTKGSLRSLVYDVGTKDSENFLEICGRQKLEVLNLSNNWIVGVQPNFQRFPCLKSLSLRDVVISVLDLSPLLAALPRIETFELLSPSFKDFRHQPRVELCSLTLKNVFFEDVDLKKLILKANSVEYLHLRLCEFDMFELSGMRRLKHFKVDYVHIKHLCIEGTIDTLEIVDATEFAVSWSKFYKLISRSLKLKTLRLWNIEVGKKDKTVYFEKIAKCFPQLSHLSLSYDTRRYDKAPGMLQYAFQGSFQLENVVVVEVHWDEPDAYIWPWVEKLLIRCPNVRKLRVYGYLDSDYYDHVEADKSPVFCRSVAQLMRKYSHVNVELVC